VKEQEISKFKDTSLINFNGDQVLKVIEPGLQHWGGAVMNIPGVISIMDHTHFRGNKREPFYAEAYLFRSLVNCSMVQCKMKEA